MILLKILLNNSLSILHKVLFIFVFLFFFEQTAFAQFQVQTTVKESRCSANGQISLKVTGGTPPYIYQLIGSTRPVQSSETFDLLPPAIYQIRITDNIGANMVVNATVIGNYQPPTTNCTVNNYDASLTTTGGRLPFRYAYAPNSTQNFSQPQTSPVFTCLPNSLPNTAHNFRVYDSCDNFHTTSCTVDVKPLVDTIRCENVRDKINVTLTGAGGGSPPYSFTCISNAGDTFRNTTGNFTQMRGCSFQYIMTDKCQRLEKTTSCTTLKGYAKCANFNDRTATVFAANGIPPYRFQSLDTTSINTNGIFANLPITDTYQFRVTDSAGCVNYFDVSKMTYFRFIGATCPFDSTFKIELNQNISIPDSCRGCLSFYPYRFNCLNCVPPRTIVDNSQVYVNPIRPFADFTPQAPGFYKIEVKNGCGDTIILDVESKRKKPPLNLSFDCKTNKIIAKTGLGVGVTYVLRDSLKRILETNATGIFTPPYTGLFYVDATFPSCDPAQDNIKTAVNPVICYGLSSKVNPTTGKCEFKWIMNGQANFLSTYNLRGGPDNINVTNNTGSFKDIEPSSTYILKTDCTLDTIKTPAAYLPNLTVQIVNPCSIESNILARGARSFGGCLQTYVDKYVLTDSVGNVLASNFTGIFPAIRLGKTYYMKLITPEGCYIQTVLLKTAKYERPNLTASYGVICAPGQTTGNIRAILRGGLPPYNYQIISPANIRTPIISSQNTVIFANLIPGNYTLRVSDSCGISSDFATSVGPLQFTPQYKRRCDGTFTLDVPFIDSATYKWTNSAGTVVGNDRILTLKDTTAQTFTINISTPQPCNFTNSITIPRFSPANINANAGADFVSTTPTTNLRAQANTQATTGRWRQIEPSSGTTIFGNAASPNTSITVSNVPGEYIYVWEVTDNASGCTIADTVVGIFCSDAVVLDATISTSPSLCKTPTGKASVTVTNTSLSITYRWSNGKTTPSVDSLAAGTYTVTISSPLQCSPPRVDTVVIKTPNPIPPRTIDTILCVGTSLKIGTKTYTQNGNYKDTLQTAAGCDSIINSNLRFSRVPIENLGIIHNLNAKYCGDSLALNTKGDTSSLYQWRWQNVSCPTCRNPSILPLSTPIYIVTITDRLTKCTTKDTVNVQIEGGTTERIPNAFSPNGDGVNDVFNVIPDNCIKVVTRLRIFNRWGQCIFDKGNLLPQKNEGWQGLNGTKSLASDVYAYIMEIEFIDGTTKKVSGEVNLIN